MRAVCIRDFLTCVRRCWTHSRATHTRGIRRRPRRATEMATTSSGMAYPRLSPDRTNTKSYVPRRQVQGWNIRSVGMSVMTRGVHNTAAHHQTALLIAFVVRKNKLDNGWMVPKHVQDKSRTYVSRNSLLTEMYVHQSSPVASCDTNI